MQLTIDDLTVLDRYFPNLPYRNDAGKIVRRKPDRSDWQNVRLQLPPGMYEDLAKLSLEVDVPGVTAMLVIAAARILREN